MKAEYINPNKVGNQKYYDLIIENDLNEIIYRYHLSFDYLASNSEMIDRVYQVVDNINAESEDTITIQEIIINNPEAWQF